MTAILVIFFFQTATNALEWYQTWYAFIEYQKGADQVLFDSGLEGGVQILIGSITDLLSTFRYVIADGIMACLNCVSCLTNSHLGLGFC